MRRPTTSIRHIADEYADVDPEDDPAAPYVGKALTALAGYMLRGLPEIGLKPNPEVAADYLNNASATFNDDDAQFELAKLQLKGEGVELDVPKAKHWLATLSRKGHAGAQAFLADLLWRGMYMEANQSQALALISVAASNAQPQDRLWIDDIHQNIYCGSGEGIRKQASGIVAGWGDRYSVTKKPDVADRSGLGMLTAQPVRTCENGEPVGTIALEPMSCAIRHWHRRLYAWRRCRRRASRRRRNGPLDNRLSISLIQASSLTCQVNREPR